ncbi:MAG: hypothetical protein AABX07_02790 [Nanoarchaeota archaeon]
MQNNQENSTILLDKKVIQLLKQAREYPRETYNETISKIAKMFIEVKKQKEDSYDKYLHEIQKRKMKELWDNQYDEIWEQA